ncbi:hypothetical protein ACFCYX_35400 [Streptomyces populi]|uniref:hypothetical protein n=1 Tax=Streptomyces populi TaxID=2058924 RepID=UPI0013A6DF5F|nr:hypothetical protein [Streptomyces populi]
MMAKDGGESGGYTITSNAREVLEQATQDYRSEVLVKARLNADGRKSSTVTDRDVALAAQGILAHSGSAYIRISKNFVVRLVLVMSSFAAAGLLGYLIVAGAADPAVLVASVVGLAISLTATRAGFFYYRDTKDLSAKASPRGSSDDARKWEIVHAWLNIEQSIREDLEERDISRTHRTRPVGEMLDEYARWHGLSSEFRESLHELISARNKIAHGVPFDLSDEKYDALIARAEDAMRAIGGTNSDDPM